MDIGIIAEEKNDLEVLYALTCKLVRKESFSFNKKFFGHGCGKIRCKCSAWADNLSTRGCPLLVVIHDLDKSNEHELRNQLFDRVKHVKFKDRLILIPVNEIEAWLLTDANALKKVFRLSKLPKLPPNPEKLNDPKKTILEIVQKFDRKQYVNTIHNKKIAEAISISKLKGSKSFLPYINFIGTHLKGK